MSRKQIHIQAHYYLALLIAFFLPTGRFAALFIALSLLNWLIEGDFKNKFQIIFQNKFALIFIGFYLLHLIGMLYTTNIDFGLFDLQVKLSLLILPLLLVSRPLNISQVNKVFVFFIAGGIVASFILLSRAIYIYATIHENNFFYQAFSIFVHPSYLSMYFNVCIVWLLLALYSYSDNKSKYFNAYATTIILFFSFIIVLLSSKLGLLTLVLIYLVVPLYLIIKRKKYVIGIVGVLLISISSFCLIRFVPEIGDRLNNAIHAISSSSDNQTDTESTAVRLLIWKAGNQVISENFIFGAGTGDSKDALMSEYQKRGMTGAYGHKLNAHNEFYQVFVSIGLIGFIVFLVSLFYPLIKRFKQANAIYGLFLVIIILNFIPESMLESQAGVMFYAFFNSLLCFCTNFVPDLET